MFPKRIKQIDNTQIKIQQKYLVKKFELQLDRLRCVGCGICSTVCPKDAIEIGPAAAQYGNKTPMVGGAIVEAINEEKCVYCGTCTYFCPFDAIHIFEDGVKHQDKDQKIVTKTAVPKLDGKAVRMFRLKRDANVYWEGTMKVKLQFPTTEADFKQYYLNKCPGDCHKCEDICPNDAIRFKEQAEAWKSKVLIEVDDEKCIKCGACCLVCPQDNFDVQWTKVKIAGPYNEIFWTPIEEKLLKRTLIKAKKSQ